MDNDLKPLEELEQEFQEDQPKPLEPQYEIVRSFSHGARKVNPGDELPDLSEAAMASLLRKGVLKAKAP